MIGSMTLTVGWVSRGEIGGGGADYSCYGCEEFLEHRLQAQLRRVDLGLQPLVRGIEFRLQFLDPRRYICDVALCALLFTQPLLLQSLELLLHLLDDLRLEWLSL